MKCKHCESVRVVGISGKCSDMCSVEYGTIERDGYVPSDLGIGGGDYISFSFCMDCGKLQKKFPLPPADIEAEGD
jgi:hypothetical protein